MGDRDAEEVVKFAHVCQGKLGAEGGGDPVEKMDALFYELHHTLLEFC
jgi:hypothetical protein